MEVIDYTFLKKRGLLKVPETNNEEDFVDLTSVKSNDIPSTNSSSAMSDFGFLSNMASIGAGNETNTPSASSDSEISSLKIKLDNLEYKFERLIEKMEKIEGKLGCK